MRKPLGHISHAEVATHKSGSARFVVELKRGFHQTITVPEAPDDSNGSAIQVLNILLDLVWLSRFPFKVFGDISPSSTKNRYQCSVLSEEKSVFFLSDQGSSSSSNSSIVPVEVESVCNTVLSI